MKKKHFYYLATLLFLISMASGFAYSESSETEGLPQASNDESQSATTEAFDKMMAVLTHKRCVNCHPSGDRPRQGEDSHYHNFGVQRGEDNHGLPALQCATCHQQENNDFSGVPGALEVVMREVITATQAFLAPVTVAYPRSRACPSLTARR